MDGWKLRTPGSDNHWLDCLVSCAVAANMQGSLLCGRGQEVRRQRQVIPLATLQRLRHQGR